MLPQIIVLSLYAIGFGYHAAKHGQQKKEEKYNAWTDLVARLIAISLLYWGGFFDVFTS